MCAIFLSLFSSMGFFGEQESIIIPSAAVFARCYHPFILLWQFMLLCYLKEIFHPQHYSLGMKLVI